MWLFRLLFPIFQRIERKLDLIIERQNAMAKSLDDLTADVAAESTAVDGLITLTSGIKAQLDAALAGGLTPDQQAKVDAIFAAVDAKKADIAAAITVNTTPTPVQAKKP